MRSISLLSSQQGAQVQLNGQEVLMLGSNNYLGLAAHPRIKQAVVDAVERYGVGTCINPCFVRTPVHAQLEEEIASHLGVQDAVLFASCSAANAGVLATLARAGDTVFSDHMNHASIVDGCRLSRADTRVYEYCSAASLAKAFSAHGPSGKRLAITDGVFSMEGDLAPLPDLLAACTAAGAQLVVDDSHATGVMGRHGAGSCSAAGIDPSAVVLTGTFSKALGGAPGGFAAGSRALADELRQASRSFIFTTGMSAADAAAALAALRELRENPSHLDRLWENTARLRQLLRQAGVAVEDAASPITALKVGDADRARAIFARLLSLGVYIPVMVHPVVAHGDARLRAQPSAALSPQDVARAAAAIAQAFEESAA